MSEKLLSKAFDYFIQPINDKWGVILLDDFGLNLHNSRIQGWLEKMSEHFPVLVFNYGEDHGWIYNLFSMNSIISAIDINYELEWSLVYALLEAKYPHLTGDPSKLFDVEDVQPLYRQVSLSEVYHRAVDNMYREHLVDKFSVLGVSSMDISRLKSGISAEQYKNSHESMRSQADSFRKVLGFEEVTGMSYQYLKRQQ